jgi:hypothetical protein
MIGCESLFAINITHMVSGLFSGHSSHMACLSADACKSGIRFSPECFTHLESSPRSKVMASSIYTVCPCSTLTGPAASISASRQAALANHMSPQRMKIALVLDCKDRSQILAILG